MPDGPAKRVGVQFFGGNLSSRLLLNQRLQQLGEISRLERIFFQSPRPTLWGHSCSLRKWSILEPHVGSLHEIRVESDRWLLLLLRTRMFKVWGKQERVNRAQTTATPSRYHGQPRLLLLLLLFYGRPCYAIS